MKEKYAHLKKKRLSYPIKFKAQVIEDREKGMKPCELVEKFSNFRLDEPKISRWVKQKDSILKAAASEHKNLMKIRPSIKYNKLFDHLKIVFDDARAKGQVVDFNWIWSKARKLNRELGKEDEIKKHVVVIFIKRNKLKYRIQRNKKQEKEHFREKMVKWHASLRERLIRTGQSNAQYDQKWGYFKPSQRYNVDQSPLSFSYECRKTHESPEADKKVGVSQSNANSGKRFCTLNICFRPEGGQPRVRG